MRVVFVKGKFSAGQIRNTSPGFLNNQGPCGHVPGAQFHFPEPVKPAACRIAEV